MHIHVHLMLPNLEWATFGSHPQDQSCGVHCSPFIQCHLVSDVNPTDDLTNSNLEHVGIVAHADVLAQHTEGYVKQPSVS